MKKHLALLFLVAFGISVVADSPVASAEDTTDTGRVSAVVELNDGELQSLLQTGVFKMTIPAAYKNKVNSLILKRPERFKDKVAVLFNDVQKRYGTVAISVDDSTIEQISYQPVELKIYESGYSNILVRYQPGNGRQKEKLSKLDSVPLKVIMKNGKSLKGSLANLKQIKVKSNLGKVNVKLSETSEISFLGKGKVRVLMLNGDSFSGDAGLRTITVISRFGRELIKTDDVATLVTSQRSVNSIAHPINSGGVIHSLPPYQDHLHSTINTQLPQQVYPQQVYPPQAFPAQPLPAQPFPTQAFPAGSFLGQPVLPAPQTYLPPSNSFPVGGGTLYGTGGQIPVSEFPVDTLMQQPLPQMQPEHANDFWLFPQN